MITRLEQPYTELHLKSILHPLVNKWFFSKFKTFTQSQLSAVYPIHCRKNILISSPTGSGKTLTAFLSVLNELISSSESGVLEDRVYCIYISPLKALGADIQINLLNPLQEMEELSKKKLGIRIGIRTGDTTTSEKAKMLKHSPHILITTPESLAIMINSPKFKEKLTKLQWVIVDEVHAIADSKRGVHLNLTLERLERLSPKFTRVGLSATIAPLEEIAKYLVGYEGDFVRDCDIVDVQYIKSMDLKVISPVKSLVDVDYMMMHQKMYELIHELVQEHKTTLIFTNTRSGTERVVHTLKERFPKNYTAENIAAHHGSLSKDARFQTEQLLREGKLKVVVSSTSLELGIDIGFIDLVICLGSPKSVARFLQRCLPYDAPVLLEDGSYLSIGQIVEERLPVKVISYDEEKGFVSREIIEYHKNYDNKLIGFILRCGERIECTPEHPLLTRNGWKKAKDITLKDKIGEVQNNVIFNQQNIYLYSLLPSHLTYVYDANNYFRDLIDGLCIKNKLSLRKFSEEVKIPYGRLIDLRRFSGRKKSILLDHFLKVCKFCKVPEVKFVPYLTKLKYKGKSWCELPLKLNQDLLWIAGLIATDGCIVRNFDKRYSFYYYKVKFSNSNLELVNTFISILHKYNIGYYQGIREEDNSHSIEIGNNLIAYLLQSLGIPCKNKSSSLKLSPLIFKLNSDLIHAFIEGVFEGDGNYNKKYPLLRIFSCSPEFVKQLHYLCARLGYHTHINQDKSKVSKKVPKINLFTIFILTLSRFQDIKKFMKAIPKIGPKAKSSYRLMTFFVQHHQKISKVSEHINWEDITSINESSPILKPVYNLTIKDNSNFIVGNIITHNCGRAGHQLHAIVKGRIIVMDRDDLVECSVLLKSALDKKIDQVHIPQNALDVLAQHIYGIAINEVINISELFHLIQKSYCYHTLEWNDFFETIKYLSGQYVSLEERHVYARIWYDPETGNIGKKGKLARVIYMTNIGTIPEEHYITVKVGEQIVGMIDEGFLERLRPGDVFVLGGNVYMFRFTRGMTAQVSTSVNRPPTVPSWFSEMLPLSFDLASEISRFRRLMEERFASKKSKEEIIQFLNDFLTLDDKAANSIYQYFYEQYNFSKIPTDKRIVIENYTDRGRNYVIFHCLFGRRVNDCLSRSLAYVIGKSQHRDVEIGITDNGFYLSSEHKFNASRAFELLQTENFREIMEQSIERSEILQRRFRHCAARSLMILREYMGRKKNVGRMQINSKILFNAVKQISENFPVLKEARREVLEDMMDAEHTQWLIKKIIAQEIKVEEVPNSLPSPFAFGLIIEGYSDVIKIEDKQEFLRRMHEIVMAKISLKQGKSKLKQKEQERENFSYAQLWEQMHNQQLEDKDSKQEKLKIQVWGIKHVPIYAKEEIVKWLSGGKIREDILQELKKHRKNIEEDWPEELKEWVLEKMS